MVDSERETNMLTDNKIVSEDEYLDFFPQENDPLIPRSLAARRIGVKATTMAIWDCHDKYKMNPVRMGNRVYYHKSTVERVRQERQK